MEYINILKVLGNNKSYLKVLFTHRHFQVAISNINPGEKWGEQRLEVEAGLLVLWGKGRSIVAGEQQDVVAGDFICISADTAYSVINIGIQPLKFIIIFPAAVFKDGTDEGSKVAEILDPYKIRR